MNDGFLGPVTVTFQGKLVWHWNDSEASREAEGLISGFWVVVTATDYFAEGGEVERVFVFALGIEWVEGNYLFEGLGIFEG